MNKEFDVYNQKRGVKLQIGDEFKTLDGCDVKVIDVLNAGSCVIQFQDEHKHEMTVVSSNLRRGAVKNPWTRLLGGSYIGYGKYNYKDNAQSYAVWRNMINRCYNPKSAGQVRGNYAGCSVSEDWLCFQNFCEWYENHKDYGKGWHVDKDIKYKGNKEYSAENCIMIPREINSIFVGRDKGVYPTGVKRNLKRFQAVISMFNKITCLGTYDTIEEAYEIHLFAFTEVLIHAMETVYKDILSEEVKSLIINHRQWDT